MFLLLAGQMGKDSSERKFTCFGGATLGTGEGGLLLVRKGPPDQGRGPTSMAFSGMGWPWWLASTDRGM